MNGNAHFKRSILLTLIGLGLNALVLLFSFIYFSVQKTFAEFFVLISPIVIEEGTTVGQMLEQLGITAEYFYVGILTMNIIYLAFDVILLIFTLLCRNDHKLNLINFNRKKVLHIFYIIFIGLGFLVFDTNLVSTFSPYSSFTSLLDTATFVLYIIAFYNAIKGTYINSKFLTSIDGYNNSASKKYYQGYSNHEYDNVNEEYEKGKEDEVIDIVDNDEENDNHIDYEELYTLLAKLERQYKNGEIDEENYNRMKKTILDNYK